MIDEYMRAWVQLHSKTDISGLPAQIVESMFMMLPRPIVGYDEWLGVPQDEVDPDGVEDNSHKIRQLLQSPMREAGVIDVRELTEEELQAIRDRKAAKELAKKVG